MTEDLPTGDATTAPGVYAAPAWQRVVALIIDGIPWLTLWGLGALAITHISAEPVPNVPWNLLDQIVDYIQMRPGAVVACAVWFVVLAFAWPLVWQVRWGRTPGERVVGIELVRRVDGGPISAHRYATHCALRVATSLLLLVGPLWALADSERRTLYDRLAGVLAIRPDR